jgi:hypothetical protein
MTTNHSLSARTWAIWLLSVVPILWATPGFAQNDDDDDAPAAKSDAATSKDSETPAASGKPTEGAKGETHESLVPPKAAEPEEPPPVGPIERLPPTAYPEWKTRGIKGGSLWFSGNMNGMPWPYYPKTGIGVSGYIWVDTGYESLIHGNPSDTNIKQVLSEGRALLRVTPTYSASSWYVQGQLELVGNKDQSVGQPTYGTVDDLWIRTGQWKSWDVELGRYEAFEVYHFGMGMDLNTLERRGAYSDKTASPPDVFELGGHAKTANIVYRQDGATNLALHAYPTDSLRLELLGQFGFDTASGTDTLGVRPAAVFDLGWLKLKAAGDFRKESPIATSSKASQQLAGGVGALQFVVDPFFEFGGNIAYGKTKSYLAANSTDPNAAMGDVDTQGSVTDLDVGGFANVRVVEDLLVGGGVNENQETDLQAGRFTHLQAFGAIQYLIGKQLFVKLVGAYAKAHFAPGGVTPWDNTAESARLRLMYLF